MFEILLCWWNLNCHFNNIRYSQRPKYPPDVAMLCQYFEDQKVELPEYCEWKSEITPPRRRSEF
jgi:hypothetical protein